jgi:tetratricopeptide (TPR) repeat protein
MVAVIRAVRPLLDGSLDAAERQIETASAIGERTVPWNAAVTRQLQLFVLRWEQGRLDENRAEIERAVAAYSNYPVWRCVLACLSAELGLAAKTGEVLTQLAAADFGELPFDEEWLLGMSLLAEACVYLGDGPRAAVLHKLLTPYDDLHAVSAPEVSIGAVARALGNLAATDGRCEQAEEHFEKAIQLNERIGARPWVARTRYDFARMLIARGRPADRQRALTLLEQALHDYRELGMRSWADRTVTLESVAQSALG